MLIYYKIFENLFNDPNITPSRFLNFCMFLYDAMDAGNADGKYTAAMAQVKGVIDAMEKEITEVDTGLNSQVSLTSGVNQVIIDFGQFMKNNNGAISYALGGMATAAYREFYPYKNEEYLNANKTTMPVLVARIYGLADKYSDQLGKGLTSDLQAFQPAYKEALTAQRKQVTNVNQNRNERNSAFTDGQWTLTGIVHDIANLNNRNMEESKKMFPFTMLFPVTKQKAEPLTGKLAASESRELLNSTLTASVKVSIKNTSENADMMVWLAASPTDAAPETAVVVNATKKISVTADKLGDLAGTFLMIKNMSDINEATYVVDISGLKKGNDGELKVKSIKMKIA